MIKKTIWIGYRMLYLDLKFPRSNENFMNMLSYETVNRVLLTCSRVLFNVLQYSYIIKAFKWEYSKYPMTNAQK